MYKRVLILMLAALLLLGGCSAKAETGAPLVVASTKPMAVFTAALLEDTDVRVEPIVSESISCLHDYSLSVRQMELMQSADAVVLSGAGLEDFMGDALKAAKNIIDASAGIETKTENGETDPHIWLDPARAATMAETVADALISCLPQYADAIAKNRIALAAKLDELTQYGHRQLDGLTQKNIITFHDGFAYFADAFGLNVLAAIEEEAGSEIAAADLKEIIGLVRAYRLPAVFTEENGVDNAAKLVAAETGIRTFSLDTGLGDTEYFAAMRHNIDTVREALS